MCICCYEDSVKWVRSRCCGIDSVQLTCKISFKYHYLLAGNSRESSFYFYLFIFFPKHCGFEKYGPGLKCEWKVSAACTNTVILVSIARDQLKQFYFEVTLLNKREIFIHLLSFSKTNFLLKKKARSSLKLSKKVKLSIPMSSNLKMQRKSKNGSKRMSWCRKHKLKLLWILWATLHFLHSFWQWNYSSGLASLFFHPSGRAWCISWLFLAMFLQDLATVHGY